MLVSNKYLAQNQGLTFTSSFFSPILFSTLCGLISYWLTWPQELCDEVEMTSNWFRVCILLTKTKLSNTGSKHIFVSKMCCPDSVFTVLSLVICERQDSFFPLHLQRYHNHKNKFELFSMWQTLIKFEV